MPDHLTVCSVGTDYQYSLRSVDSEAGLFDRTKGCLAARLYSGMSDFPEHLSCQGAGKSTEGFLTWTLLWLIIPCREDPTLPPILIVVHYQSRSGVDFI